MVGIWLLVACGSLAEQFGKLWHSDIMRARSCPSLYPMCISLCICVFTGRYSLWCIPGPHLVSEAGEP